MKTKILLLAAAFSMAASLQAQAPQKFNYQGIARTSIGAPMVNQMLGLEITILNGTTAQYVERHTATTNAIGLYTVQIGGGTPVTGTMGAVTWSAGNKNIKVGIDPNGGTNYTDMGTTELLSVPYALYAQGLSGWATDGNAASATDFIGTTNDQALRFKVNGEQAGVITKSPTSNTSLGYLSLNALTTGSGNAAVGGEALVSNTTGYNNAAMGRSVLILNTTGSNNAALGRSALEGNTTGSNNVALGVGALGTNATGSDNIGIGYLSGVNAGALTNATAIGTRAQVSQSNSIVLGSISGVNDATANTKVGIGTTAPSYPLTLKGSGVGFTQISTDGTTELGTYVETGAAYIQTNTNHPLHFTTSNGMPKMTLATNGNVGVGTTTPNRRLTVKYDGIGFAQASLSGTTELGTKVTDVSAYIQTNTNSPLRFATNNGAARMTVFTNGKVAIGTSAASSTAPTAHLEVQGTSFATSPQLRLRETSDQFSRIHFQNSRQGAWVLAGKKEATAANSVFNVFYSPAADGDLTGGYDIMSISGNGKIGINTSTSGTGWNGGALTIRPKNTNDAALRLFNYMGGYHWSFRIYDTNQGDLELGCNNTLVGAFNHTSGSYSTYSDRRLKENIAPANNVLDQIKGVEVMRYTFKTDENHKPQLGYIAQNLEEHFPEFVTKPNTEVDKEGYYTVNYAGMSAVAIKAIQEQQAMIESLQQAMAKMQARLEQLEK